MNIEYKAKRKKDSTYNNRFYTSLDMSIIKKDAANRNGQIKRGEVPDFANNYISVCGCGREGCFIHSGFNTIPQEEMNDWAKNKQLPHHKPKPTKVKIAYKDWKSLEFLKKYLRNLK